MKWVERPEQGYEIYQEVPVHLIAEDGTVERYLVDYTVIWSPRMKMQIVDSDVRCQDGTPVDPWKQRDLWVAILRTMLEG